MTGDGCEGLGHEANILGGEKTAYIVFKGTVLRDRF